MDHSQTAPLAQTNEASHCPQSDCKEGEVFSSNFEGLPPPLADTDISQIERPEPPAEPKARTKTVDGSERERGRACREMAEVGPQSTESRGGECEQSANAADSQHVSFGEHSRCLTQPHQPGGSLTEGSSVSEKDMHEIPKTRDLPFKPHHILGNGASLLHDTAGEDELEVVPQKGSFYPTGHMDEGSIKENNANTSSFSIPRSATMLQSLTSESRISPQGTIHQNTMDFSVQLDVPHVEPDPELQDHLAAVEKSDLSSSKQTHCDHNIVISERVEVSGNQENTLAESARKYGVCTEVELNPSLLGEQEWRSDVTRQSLSLHPAVSERCLEKGESQRTRFINSTDQAQVSGFQCQEKRGKENLGNMVQSFLSPHYKQKISKPPKPSESGQTREGLHSQYQSLPQTGSDSDSLAQPEQSPPPPYCNFLIIDDNLMLTENDLPHHLSSLHVLNVEAQSVQSQDSISQNRHLNESSVNTIASEPDTMNQTTCPLERLTRGDAWVAENEIKEHVNETVLLDNMEGKDSSLQALVGTAEQKDPRALDNTGTVSCIETQVPKITVQCNITQKNSPCITEQTFNPRPLSLEEGEVEMAKVPFPASAVRDTAVEGDVCSSDKMGRKDTYFLDASSISKDMKQSSTCLSGELSREQTQLTIKSVERDPISELPVAFQGKNRDAECYASPVLTDCPLLKPKVAAMEKEKCHEPLVIERAVAEHEVIKSDPSLSSSVVDPQLLTLNLADAPFLKQSATLEGGLSSNPLPHPVPQVTHSPTTTRSHSSCGSGTDSVECPSKSGVFKDSGPEPKLTCSDNIHVSPTNRSETASGCLPSVQNMLVQACSAPSPLKHHNLGAVPEVKTSPASTCRVSQNLDISTMATSVFPLSIPASSALVRNVLSSVNTELSQHTLPKEDFHSGQPFTDILKSEKLQQSTLSQLSVIDTHFPAEERHSTPSGKIADSEDEISGNTQASSSSFMTPSPAQNKVCQWRADRILANSSPPPAPSTSTALSLLPLPSSSLCGWSSQVERAVFPQRGPHGKFISLSARGQGGTQQSDLANAYRPRAERHTDMAELAKHEAEIEHRTLALKREGFWSLKRLSRVAEPGRPKVHWDYLCEEMQWLSADFAQERRWKRGVARKVVRMVMRHHEEQRQKEEKAKREEQAKLRRVASSIAKEIRAFWSSVEKVVQFKQQSRLEEKRKKALDLQLDFIVGQTERYSDLLSQSLSEASVAVPPTATLLAIPEPTGSTPKGQQQLTDEDDGDFEPLCEEEDDEETIEVEEQQEGNDAETQKREIELLRHEGTLPLDQLLHTLTLTQDTPSDDECSEGSSSVIEEEDDEFTANEDDAEDEEETIAAQEVVEGEADHSEELGDLAREGEMTLEELLEKYRGAYTEDFEMPSASVSPTSSEEESVCSGDREEDSEGEDSGGESSSCSGSSANLESDDEGGEGMEILLKGEDRSPPCPATPRPKKEISHIAATAESLQPKGYTLATTQVKTPIPFLLHGTLREYQHIGLDWLVTMYEKKLNGILADEMGLGKTIQTIALLAHLACEKGNWGPHLIIVPTSVMLNWEMELKRWCPSFKILTYYGSQKERKLKRQGWTKPNAFHVCITSYKLVLQDHQAFRRKSWRYLILDEAQNIKNFKSQRWQSLLNFNSQRRLLLTGTPLQNSLMELWSLMHFLMPHVFQSHREFKEWFSNPLTGMIEGSQEYNEGLVKRLHKVLRPFLLRRIKADVEKQMPKKYEHVVRCRLSKRQRFLYDDFMAQASTRETLASGHFMSVINILMQLRKVCNHPNLFDPRPIHSPFITPPILFSTASLVQHALDTSPFKCCDLSMFDLVGLEGRVSRYQADVFLPRRKVTPRLVHEIMDSPDPPPRPKPVRMKVNRMFQPLPKTDGRAVLLVNSPRPPCPDHSASPALRSTMVMDTAPPATPVQPVPQVSVSSIPAAVTVCAGSGTAVRQGAPVPVMSVRPPSASSAAPLPAFTPPPSSTMTQRVLLSPDMQARLPSGEVVSIAQLASLAGRPVSSCQGSKPVTFQLQGNKLTLSGAQLHQVTMAQPRPIQGNLVHLLSSGGQHHLISQPTQVAVIQAVSQGGGSTVNTHPTTAPPGPPGLTLPLNPTQVPSSMVPSPGIVKIVVRQSTGKEGGAVPTVAVPPSPRVPSVSSSAFPPHTNTTSSLRPPVPIQCPASHTAPPPTELPRPVLRVLQGSGLSSDQARLNAAPGREDSSDVVTLRMAAAPNLGSLTGGLASPRARTQPPPPPRSPFYMTWLADRRKLQREWRLARILRINEQHCSAKPVYGREVLDFLTFLPGTAPSPPAPKNWANSGHTHCSSAQSHVHGAFWVQSEVLRKAIYSTEERLQLLSDVIDRYIFVIPPVEAPPITMHSCHPPPWLSHQQAVFSSTLTSKLSSLTGCLHRIQCNMRTHFPDLRLIQYDCGKLQTLHSLLRRLKAEGHRVLIFTQMTRMLDVLEQFLNYHGHIYLRLDGSTRVEQRQALMERFNADRRIFCFILSTRSGGVGVNLTGADTVVFYDSDWNPTMDAQAQDRCHRIGQTRDVHIYRLISERTVEENILKKANQKRMLGDMAIEGGNFTTAFFKQQTIRELFDVSEGERKDVELSLPSRPEEEETFNKQHTTILEQALCRAEDEEDIVAASQAKAEQVAELAEFNESIPFEEAGEGMVREQEEEELSKAEQEIAALVEQLTPIERYAMNFLEASLEDVCKEELKQAEEQVEAARKGLDQAKEELSRIRKKEQCWSTWNKICPLFPSPLLCMFLSNTFVMLLLALSSPSRTSSCHNRSQ
ncbi:hypothetical protein MATL_G00021200 [Megalops atlanticus]|uniref:Snf2-related CREBBP activator protein n=1 Tax=Megalops atlanticus TaxID=7932 RepID=A0A9D3QJJ0_MEGAT|nr:hypothetical protein MATL_G00021200 [Megalops atlanticus]